MNSVMYPDAGAEHILTTLQANGQDHPLLRQGLIFDVDGVLCWGEEAIPGSVEAIQRLRDGGKRVIFISNNSTKSREEYLQKFGRLGIPVIEDDLVLSTYATAQYVAAQQPGARVYMVGAPGLQRELELAGLELMDDPFQADYVVVGSAFDGTGKISEANSLRITGALRALYHAQARFIATNPDRIFPAKDGVIPGTGAVIGALSYMAERQPEAIIGKPATHIVQIALDRLELAPQACAIVGDMDTDMLAGERTGVSTVFVRSGAMQEAMLRETFGISPDFTYDAVIDMLKLA
ncbi:HAD-IIA family hydrolase [candidate division KSB3 bacterium]|uniref:HAD-IIA family hydrolase n=1 Tax=candidate division KSB3 bacterium TaxID=2044937 RepID=A0A9D5JWL5_9BACT|nr:HAD-IIA family hydrolase [candidate division KSB3 bacterium]MBD3325629.1 HAD-IIA family hydrolase [candidate division KSB3 bacterium]